MVVAFQSQYLELLLKLVLYATFFGVWRRYGLTVEDFNLAHRIVQPIFRTQTAMYYMDSLNLTVVDHIHLAKSKLYIFFPIKNLEEKLFVAGRSNGKPYKAIREV
ncbi:hypothetical protein HKD37_14G039743 [Glycine soja]